MFTGLLYLEKLVSARLKLNRRAPIKKLIISLFILSYATFAFSKSLIVLIPGAASSGEFIWIKGFNGLFKMAHQQKYFQNLNLILKENGYAVYTCPQKQDEDTTSLVYRSEVCQKELKILLLKDPDLQFHLIGHSMGGLIGRALLDELSIQNRILSLTTISTPHRGALIANYAQRHANDIGPIGILLRATDFTPKKKKYLEDLYWPESSFRSQLQNKTNIPVYSISNYKTNLYNAPFEVTHQIIKYLIDKFGDGGEKKNDGIVESSSMIFGEHLGEIQADHMESGCIFYAENSQGCRNLLHILLKHLQNLEK